jgi:hypothetical protein
MTTMMMLGKIAALAAGAIAVAAAPAMAQTEGTAPAVPAQLERAQDRQGGMGMDPAAMREMMREMMQEMMQERGSASAGEGEEEEALPQPRWRDGRHMGRRGMMDGRGMMGGRGMAEDRPSMRGRGYHMGSRMAHGAGMRIFFAIIDADGDGALSLEEINDFHERIFNAVDLDGNGRVTIDEIRTFFHGGEE